MKKMRYLLKLFLPERAPGLYDYTYGDGADILTLEGKVKEDYYILPVPSFTMA